ncbi:LysR family transcriptional regulator, partial [Cribrihabitans sp. XS_ASV171]
MISLKDLEFLSALARRRHFARAAEDCGVSQPAFSMRIRKIEERLDTPIVRRGNRFQGFTPEGEALVRHARTIVEDMKAMEQEFRSAKGEVTGRLTIGVIPTAVVFAARAVNAVRRRHPGITFGVYTATSLAIQQGIENGLYDAGITYGEGVSRDLLQVEDVYA